MGINIIDTSKFNEIKVKETVSKLSTEELLEYHRGSWSDYADSMNCGFCHNCSGYDDVCCMNCPCQHHRVSEKELSKRGIFF